MRIIKRFAPSKLSTRTALLFGSGLFAIAAICLFFTRYFFLMNLNDIERQQLLQHSNQARTMIDVLVQDQLKRSFDWANWDESYELVTKGDKAYGERNLYYDGLKMLDLDLMIFLNLEGKVVESTLATEEGMVGALPAEMSEQIFSRQGLGPVLKLALANENPRDLAHAGLILIDNNPLIITVSPIRDSLRERPVGGWLIWGRYLSSVFPERFSDILLADNTLVAITPETDINAQQFPYLHSENDGNNLAASIVLNDINGKPLAVLKSSRPRTVYQQGNQLISWLAIAMFAAAVVIGLLTLFAFRLKVGSRFLAFEKGLEALVRDQYSTQIRLEGNDEFSMVGEVINQIIARSSHSESALNDVAEKFEALYRTSNLGLLMVLDGQIVDANDTIASILHYSSGKVLTGQSLLNLCPGSNNEFCQVEKLYKAVTEGQKHFETELLAADGRLVACKLEVIPIQQQSGEALMFSIKDVSQQKEQEGLIQQLEKYDPVTGLVNRQTLLSALQRKLSDEQHHSSPILPSVLYIRIERFNIVAGAFGHQMADEILIAVANELQRQVGSGVLGRVADSEFAFVLKMNSRFAPYRLAKAIVSALEQPLVVDGVEVRLSASVGVVLASVVTPTAEEMMSAAEFATYCAGNSKSRIQLFNRDIEQQMKSHIVIQQDIAKAISHGDIYPKYQPIICGETEEICGFEALARWSHPELREIPPSQFIPMAESRELIIALGSQILEKSCEFLEQVNRQRYLCGLAPLSVHVNLSSPHFSHEQLLPQLRSVLDRYQISPENLTIEITESMLMGSSHNVIQRMHAIKKMGIQLALDDFGTGYSALNSLCEFPLDVVKLDRTFVKRLGEEEQGEILISNIVSLSKALGLRMVAEGVETKLQKLALQAFNVEEFQGFYFYRPMTAEECMQVAL